MVSLCILVDRVVIKYSTDPFLANEPNPNLTLALESSLWELISHKHHYHAAVSTLAGILEQAFTRPGYPLEDFFDHTYDTVSLKIVKCDTND
jgi:U3 small nucleolar RNA-associated protein 19